MNREELLSKLPSKIFHAVDGPGELHLHSYQNKKFVAWYQFEYRVNGVCFGESWNQVNDELLKYFETHGINIAQEVESRSWSR